MVFKVGFADPRGAHSVSLRGATTPKNQDRLKRLLTDGSAGGLVSSKKELVFLLLYQLLLILTPLLHLLLRPPPPPPFLLLLLLLLLSLSLLLLITSRPLLEGEALVSSSIHSYLLFFHICPIYFFFFLSLSEPGLPIYDLV